MDDDPPNSQPQVPVEMGQTAVILGIWRETIAKGIMKMDVTSNLHLEETHTLLLTDRILVLEP